MSVRVRWVILLATLAPGMPAVSQAQVPQAATRDSLARALTALSSRVDSLAAGRCPGGLTIALPARTGVPQTDSLIAAADSLSHRVEEVRRTRCQPAPAAPAQPADTSGDLAALRAAAAAAAGGGAPTPTEPRDTTAPPPKTEFIGRQRNASALNPEISATGDIRLVARDGRQEDNGVAREFEFAFQSALDPYSYTKIFLTFEQEARDGVSPRLPAISWDRGTERNRLVAVYRAPDLAGGRHPRGVASGNHRGE
jgi:hypothetical protein